MLTLFFFFKKFFIGVWSLYSVLSVSACYIFNVHILSSFKLSLLMVPGISD